MFSISSAGSMTSTRTGESRVFLPLETGITPFPIKRAAVDVPAQFAKPNYELAIEHETISPLTGKSAQRLAAVTTRVTNIFRRRRVASVSTCNSDFEPTWFTSPDNWRPGLVTLEQAASRDDIVRRPEAFEVL